MELKDLESPLMPLKDLAARRTAILLCSHPVMHRYALARYEPFYKDDIAAIVGKSRIMLTTLALPPSIKEELVNLIKPIFKEIMKWISSHETFLQPEISCLQKIRWTCLGTVNNLETAKELIRHEELTNEERYKLACLYCLEENIRDLWKKIPARRKMLFYDDKTPGRIKQNRIVVFWTYSIKGQIDKLVRFLRREERVYSSIHQYAFEYAAIEGYRSTAQYFFEKLTSEEKEESLQRAGRDVIRKRTEMNDSFFRHENQKFSDVMFYLLTQMREEQVKILLKNAVCQVLTCIIDWPRQGGFIELAKLTFSYISCADYNQLLYMLSRSNSLGYNYSKLFRDLIQASPKLFRSYFLGKFSVYLHEFFGEGDVLTIQCIFRNLNNYEMQELMFSVFAIVNFCELIKKEKWYLIKLFFQESRMSKKIRKNYMMYLMNHLESRLDRELCQRFTQFVSEMDMDNSDQNISVGDKIKRADCGRSISLQSSLNYLIIYCKELTENPAKKRKKQQKGKRKRRRR